ncbi:MAG: DUF5711 family protein [Lachnospiraceae bacterium]|nr:DUF5711 family protein [Lachnospiraceae bacterium]
MADIRSYMKEKEKREQKKTGYREKIFRHKLSNVYRFLLVLVAVIALVALAMVQYRKHIYTDYDVVASVPRENASGAVDRRLGQAILTYSKDGAHCTDTKGNVTWNQTYEIQDIKLAISGNTVAIGSYNGRSIYVQNAEKQLTEITTTMPIRNLTVSESGYVTAVLDSTDVALLNTYNVNGEMIYQGQAHMTESGYPAAVSLSPNGELLCVAYWYVDAGILKTNIAFYNFGPVGENVNDYMVSVYSYTDTLIPQVQFMNNSTAFAVGDNRLTIYSGSHTPVETAGFLIDEEIISVFYSDKYIGLVFRAEDSDKLYRMDVFDTAAEKVGSFDINIEYTDIFFDQDTFVAYNETECMIMTMDKIAKFAGEFSETVRLMLPTNGAYKYLLVTDDSIETIQLK